MITIGHYTIMIRENGKVWIQHDDGEAGEFSLEELEKVIEKFFVENF
jgi:hypothetical protein